MMLILLVLINKEWAIPRERIKELLSFLLFMGELEFFFFTLSLCGQRVPGRAVLRIAFRSRAAPTSSSREDGQHTLPLSSPLGHFLEADCRT